MCVDSNVLRVWGFLLCGCESGSVATLFGLYMCKIYRKDFKQPFSKWFGPGAASVEVDSSPKLSFLSAAPAGLSWALKCFCPGVGVGVISTGVVFCARLLLIFAGVNSGGCMLLLRALARLALAS